jgi:hypothetical protein
MQYTRDDNRITKKEPDSNRIKLMIYTQLTHSYFLLFSGKKSRFPPSSRVTSLLLTTLIQPLHYFKTRF